MLTYVQTKPSKVVLAGDEQQVTAKRDYNGTRRAALLTFRSS
jgi:hypothetical protein